MPGVRGGTGGEPGHLPGPGGIGDAVHLQQRPQLGHGHPGPVLHPLDLRHRQVQRGGDLLQRHPRRAAHLAEFPGQNPALHRRPSRRRHSRPLLSSAVPRSGRQPFLLIRPPRSGREQQARRYRTGSAVVTARTPALLIRRAPRGRPSRPAASARPGRQDPSPRRSCRAARQTADTPSSGGCNSRTAPASPDGAAAAARRYAAAHGRSRRPHNARPLPAGPAAGQVPAASGSGFSSNQVVAAPAACSYPQAAASTSTSSIPRPLSASPRATRTTGTVSPPPPSVTATRTPAASSGPLSTTMVMIPPCPADRLCSTELPTSSLFTELPDGFPQLRGHADSFGVRDFYLRAGYVLLPCSRMLKFPVTS